MGWTKLSGMGFSLLCGILGAFAARAESEISPFIAGGGAAVLGTWHCIPNKSRSLDFNFSWRIKEGGLIANWKNIDGIDRSYIFDGRLYRVESQNDWREFKLPSIGAYVGKAIAS